MPRHEVNHLGVPPMDLTISEAGDGKLRVELNVPRSSGSQDNIPFLEVTRNEQQTLLNGARQDMISRLSRSGFQIGDIQVQTGGEQSQHTGVSGAAIVPEAAGKLSFEISSDSKIHGSLSTVLRNNPDLAGAIRETEQNFDTRRQDIYESRAREWYRNGGATIQGQNGDIYHVGTDAAKNYVNERHPLNPFERISSEESRTQVADASGLVAPSRGRCAHRASRMRAGRARGRGRIGATGGAFANGVTACRTSSCATLTKPWPSASRNWRAHATGRSTTSSCMRCAMAWAWPAVNPRARACCRRVVYRRCSMTPRTTPCARR